MVALAISSVTYDNIVLTKVVAEISKCGIISKNMSDGARKTSCQKITRATHIYLEKKTKAQHPLQFREQLPGSTLT